MFRIERLYDDMCVVLVRIVLLLLDLRHGVRLVGLLIVGCVVGVEIGFALGFEAGDISVHAEGTLDEHRVGVRVEPRNFR